MAKVQGDIMNDVKKSSSELARIHGDRVRGELVEFAAGQSLIKVNRLLLTIVFALMTVITILSFSLLAPPAANPAAIAAVDLNPALSAEVRTLKSQLVGLISGSIDSKLRTLEDNIRRGAIANSLGNIEDLRNDLQVLRVYSEPVKKQSASPSNEQLLQEVSQLKTLLYLTLSSCGLMLAAIAGIWLKNNHLLPHKKINIRFLSRK